VLAVASAASFTASRVAAQAASDGPARGGLHQLDRPRQQTQACTDLKEEALAPDFRLIGAANPPDPHGALKFLNWGLKRDICDRRLTPRLPRSQVPVFTSGPEAAFLRAVPLTDGGVVLWSAALMLAVRDLPAAPPATCFEAEIRIRGRQKPLPEPLCATLRNIHV